MSLSNFIATLSIFDLFLVNIEDVYAFSYVAASKGLEKSEGWDYYDIMDDYMRMGIPNDHWVVSDFNLNYVVSCVCGTILIVTGKKSSNMFSIVIHIHRGW